MVIPVCGQKQNPVTLVDLEINPNYRRYTHNRTFRNPEFGYISRTDNLNQYRPNEIEEQLYKNQINSSQIFLDPEYGLIKYDPKQNTYIKIRYTSNKTL